MVDVDENGNERPVVETHSWPVVETHHMPHMPNVHMPHVPHRLSLRRSLSNFSDEDETDYWSPQRLKVKKLLESTCAEYALALIIMTNLCFIVAEANHSGQCESDGLSAKQCPTVFLHIVMDYVFLGIYTLESLTRLFAFRWSFCMDLWNPFDLVIVVSGYLGIILNRLVADSDLNTLRMLRIFRIARLARTIKILRHMPELQAMIRGFKNAIGAMGYGFLFILFLLLMAGILSVELIHPINMECDTDGWCKEAFLSVIKSVLLYFQTLVAGDSWGLCAIPIIKNTPATILLFASVLVIVQLGFTNLILSVIVEKAAEARQHDCAALRRQRQEAIKKVARIARQIDSSGNGMITEEEFKEGMENDSDFRELLEVLDIDEADVSSLFYLMDADKSGDLSIEEFVRTLAKSSDDDIRKQMMFLRSKVSYHGVGVTHKMHRMNSGMQNRIQGLEGRVAELHLLLSGGTKLGSCLLPRPVPRWNSRSI